MRPKTHRPPRLAPASGPARTTVLGSETQAPAAAAAPPDLLAQLSEPTRQAVRALGRRRDYATGELVLRQGDPHDGVFLIESGVVRSLYLSEDGRELTLGYWSAGHYVGAPQMFGGGLYAWTSVAVAPTRCLWLPGAPLRALSRQRPELALALLDALVHKSQCYCALLQLLATHSMRVRLARLLAMLAARDPQAGIELSHGQLASMIGSTRQWVSQTMARFAADGLVGRHRDGGVQVLHAARLAALR